MALYKEKMIEAVIKLNPTAKFSWLEQFNTTELHMYNNTEDKSVPIRSSAVRSGCPPTISISNNYALNDLSKSWQNYST